ncbi:MAG TPA: D-glucuronyl C5-epimerase family protein [Terriglobales bacterium]|nr:D-glucuronyl C5-epimerase family protein [Terriglobales bacterium]
MPVLNKLRYYRRVFSAYLLPGTSQISFWHDSAELNPRASATTLGEYYMNFAEKARYAGPRDATGIPLLDYRGAIGRQYNPIAIAQWGLGNYNLFLQTGHAEAQSKFLCASDWLCRQLEPNLHGVYVWNHLFNWEYRQTLRAPWYSGLAQGQGISLLVRAHAETREEKYLKAAALALRSFFHSTGTGGIAFTDADGNIWFEEYILPTPTHILNGFIWAAWGVYDYWLATASEAAKELFDRAVETLRENLGRYDLGFWSLYEQSGTRLPMIASPFYHRLHITQLRVMHRLTGQETFARYADRWAMYAGSRARRTRALCYKGVFKLCYY